MFLCGYFDTIIRHFPLIFINSEMLYLTQMYKSWWSGIAGAFDSIYGSQFFQKNQKNTVKQY